MCCEFINISAVILLFISTLLMLIGAGALCLTILLLGIVFPENLERKKDG
ncbi:hypothetical protein [Emcibacter sp.]|nr:hypothetical protein [Emcibacter sp.]